MAKTFTLSEAQALLPVLRSLLTAAVEAHKKAEQLDTEMQRTITRILLLGGVQLDPLAMAARRSERDTTLQRLKDALSEMDAAGVQIKDLERGLLDFPCRMDGRVVLLCWQLGEETIAYWHGADEGYVNRKPIDPEQFTPQRRPRIQ
ncbi:MAG: DUF2203 domain-containing protein [Terriglobales bacterium]